MTNNPTTIKVLQINLDRKRLAHDLLVQYVKENKVDIVIGQEPNVTLSRAALKDRASDCFIWLPEITRVARTYQANGFIGIELGKIWYVSCYFSPNRNGNDLANYLDDLDRFIKSTNSMVIVCGDFNAKSRTCGAIKTDKKGELLDDLIYNNGLTCTNDGKNTFSNANGESLIDVTLVSGGLVQRISDWRISDVDSGSEHLYIEFNVNCGNVNVNTVNKTPNKIQKGETNGWLLTETGVEKIRRKIEGTQIPPEVNNANALVEHLKNLCDQCLTSKNTTRGARHPVYWWGKQISEKRNECHVARRAVTRARAKKSEEEINTLKSKLRETRRALRTLINQEKTRAWNTLREDLDRDIWGKGYRIIMKKFQRSAPLSEEDIQAQVRKLFPTVPTIEWKKHETNGTYQEVTADEVQECIAQLKNRKAPGPDGITVEILKATNDRYVPTITSIVNGLLSRQDFPDIWKTTRLVLIEKPGRTLDGEKAYRPICIMDTLGKILEKILNVRLQDELDKLEAIHSNQFGFRRGRSTIDALRSIEEVVTDIQKHAFGNQKCCALITLDVKNAFNSAPWDGIIRAMLEMKINNYLINICQQYLCNRKIILPNGKTFLMTCGVPQGSVLGPTLWNIYYNQILTTVNEEGIKLVAYADDLAVVVWARDATLLEETASYTLSKVSRQLSLMGLELAKHKTEATILRGWQKCRNVKINIENSVLTLNSSLKYMGVYIDKNWKFHSHIKHLKMKTQDTLKRLCRLTAGLKGPGAAKKRVLASTVQSILLYGAPIWSIALNYKTHELSLNSIIRRLALMVTGAYRSAPTEAVLVLAKIPPIKLQIKRRIDVHEKGKTAVVEIDEDMTTKWEQEWLEYRGHMKKYIPNLRQWLNCEWAEADHYLAQICTGHGVFAKHLNRIGKLQNPTCWYCNDTDDVHHTIFVCKNWAHERDKLNEELELTLSEENVGYLILKDKEHWTIITKYFRLVMSKKMEDKRRIKG